MKRNRKHKTDEDKIYKFIGQAVVYSTIYLSVVALTIWGFCQNTIY